MRWLRLNRWLIRAIADLMVGRQGLTAHHILLHGCLQDVIKFCSPVCGELLVNYVDSLHLR